jgi:hypothetical protein
LFIVRARQHAERAVERIDDNLRGLDVAGHHRVTVGRIEQ